MLGSSRIATLFRRDGRRRLYFLLRSLRASISASVKMQFMNRRASVLPTRLLLAREAIHAKYLALISSTLLRTLGRRNFMVNVWSRKEQCLYYLLLKPLDREREVRM